MSLQVLDIIDLIEGFPCVDLQTGANNGDYVAVKPFERLGIVFISGIGTAGQDPTITVQQADTAAGGNVKALNFTTIWRKQAATDLSAVLLWTKTTQTAANTYTQTDAAEQSLIWVIDIHPNDLDVANGFDYVRATVADVGANAQPGYLFYVGLKKQMTDPASNVDPLS